MGRNNRFWISTLMICALCGLLLLTGCTPELKNYRSEAVNVPGVGQSQSSDGSVQAVDAEAYLNEVGEVLNKTHAEESKSVSSGAEIVRNMDERGFSQYPITSNYSINGDYINTEITENTAEKNPSYETFYVTEQGYVWSIMDINGAIMAIPVTFNMEYAKVPVVFTETGTVMSYDSVTNCFFEVIPDPEVMTVKKMKDINAETIEKMTMEEIGKE